MSGTTDHHPWSHAASAAMSVRGLFARPKTVAIVCVVLLAAAGWIYLALMLAGMPMSMAVLGPGMGILDLLMRPDALGQALFEALCRPTFGAAGSTRAVDVLLVFAMWCAMVLAMMLPTAAAMIVAYADTAESAAVRGERFVSPLVLTAGYLSVWVAITLFATALQAGLTRAALLNSGMVAASPLFSGAIFIGAGLYQFSALKHACVTRCQRPSPFFFAHWSSKPKQIFCLGVRQGLYCLGCCWAMMTLMFAVGVMNVVWMAGLGIVMALEKIAMTTRFSRAIGVVLIAIGVVLIGTAIEAHWPTKLA